MRGRYILHSKDLIVLYRLNMNHLALFALWFRIGATVVIFSMCISIIILVYNEINSWYVLRIGVRNSYHAVPLFSELEYTHSV